MKKKSKEPEHIPMCWKCKHGRFARSKKDEGADEMVGCEVHKMVHTFEDAKKLCPLIHKELSFAIAFVVRHTPDVVKACFNSKHGYGEMDVTNGNEALGDEPLKSGCLVSYKFGEKTCTYINTDKIYAVCLELEKKPE